MAITQVGSATSTNSGGAGVASLAITLPTGWAADDVVYAWVVSMKDNATLSAAGWTDITGQMIGDCAGYVFRRVMQGGDSAPTFAHSTGTGRMVSAVIALRGVNTTTPEDVAAGTFSSVSSDTTIVGPSVTTATADAWLLSFFGNNASANTGTPPGTQTELIDAASGSNSPSIQLNKDTNPVASPGATGTRTETLAASSNGRIAATVAVRPVAAPPTAVKRRILNQAVRRGSTW